LLISPWFLIRITWPLLCWIALIKSYFSYTHIFFPVLVIGKLLFLKIWKSTKHPDTFESHCIPQYRIFVLPLNRPALIKKYWITLQWSRYIFYLCLNIFTWFIIYNVRARLGPSRSMWGSLCCIAVSVSYRQIVLYGHTIFLATGMQTFYWALFLLGCFLTILTFF